MRKSIKSRIIWAVGTAAALCGCFLLCRFVFLRLHGSHQYPAFLLAAALAAVGIAAVFDGRKIMICAVSGYIGGFAAGIIFGADGTDPGGGTTNNWWVIWTAALLIVILAGIILEIISRRLRRNNAP